MPRTYTNWETEKHPETGETLSDWIKRNHLSGGGRLSHRRCAEQLSKTLGRTISQSSVRQRLQLLGQVMEGEGAIRGTIADIPPTVVGLTADEEYDEQELWEQAIRSQRREERRREKRANQVIGWDADPGPFALALFSDLHFGGAGVDYEAMRHDAEVVRDTPGMYALYLGDGLNNWIVGKLAALQRSEALNHKEALALHRAWLRTIQDKLVAVVGGNHDNWSTAMAGLSYLRDAVRGRRILYDDDEVIFTLKAGDRAWCVKTRHAWRGGSMYNPTHAIERDRRFGDHEFDIGIGGHVHTGWYVRPFHVHGRKVLAVQIATYKQTDSFARKQGFNEPKGLGSGALVFEADGAVTPVETLEDAAGYLAFRRE